MPYRKQIADLDLKIENLRTAIDAFRNSKMSRTEVDRALSELAKVKAERLRLMLRQVNLSTEGVRHQPPDVVGPQDSDGSAARLGDSER
jgi:hypothetical protein